MDADISTLCVGDLVAVNCENSREPTIGSCTEIFEEDIEIVWMEGDYTSAWKTWKIRDPKTEEKSSSGGTVFQNYLFSCSVLR